MKIDEKLNLVLPMRSDDKGVTVRAYHTPISREVFEANYRVLAATKAALSSKGAYYLMSTGPTIASLTLRDECRKDAVERGEFDAKGMPSAEAADALLAEIRRLTNVLLPSSNGWDLLPIDTAVQQGLIDDDDWRECESSLVFFTVHSALTKKSDKARVVRVTTSVLQGLNTSLSPMEYGASLQTSTPIADISAKVASSVPS